MGGKPRIAVLWHVCDRHKQLSHYVIHHFRQTWCELGYQVEYVFGPDAYIPADVAILHVDLSVVPDEYLALAARYPVCLNGKVSDIRKTAFSSNLLSPDDVCSGPVIVKSDLNNAGLPERYCRRLLARDRPRWQQRVMQWWEESRGRDAGMQSASDYRVYDRLADVPVALRRDSSLVVERFLPEFEDGLYHMRLYQFLGDQESCARMGAKDPVVNAATHCRHEAVEPHPAIVELRHAMHFDYGKFDYVIHDGQAILLDINKTVGTGGLERTPERVRLVRLRAQGICKYLE